MDYCFDLTPYRNPPYPPFVKGGNFMESLRKSPFEKAGFRQ